MPITVAGTGCPGPVANMLNHPHGIFVDLNFSLYVADTHNNRIQLFPPDQLNATTVAGFGAIVYFILNRPTGIVLDADRYLYIVDSGNHRIIQSTLDGFRCLVGCSGESGITSSQLHNPQTMAFDNNGNIFVTDFNNNRIQKFLLDTNKCGKSIHFRSG
jgi:DNA-binding beta-propeller fold protein YncE